MTIPDLLVVYLACKHKFNLKKDDPFVAMPSYVKLGLAQQKPSAVQCVDFFHSIAGRGRAAAPGASSVK